MKRPLTIGLFLGMLALIVGVTANAARLRLSSSPPETSPPNSSEFLSDTLPAQDSLSANEQAELDKQVAAEKAIVESRTPEALYRLAESNGEPSTSGLALQSAIQSTSPGVLEGLLLVDVYSDDGGGLGYERLIYSDGTGDLEIFWQHVPPSADLAAMVGQGTVTYAGDLDVVTESRDVPGTSLRAVRVYNGDIVFSVTTTNLEKPLSLGNLRSFALDLFEKLLATA